MSQDWTEVPGFPSPLLRGLLPWDTSHLSQVTIALPEEQLFVTVFNSNAPEVLLRL